MACTESSFQLVLHTDRCHNVRAGVVFVCMPVRKTPLIPNFDSETVSIENRKRKSNAFAVSSCFVTCDQNSDSSTAFHLACAQGSLEIVQLLHSNDPLIAKLNLLDNQGMTPLHHAAANNCTAIVDFLLDQVGVAMPRDPSIIKQ